MRALQSACWCVVIGCGAPSGSVPERRALPEPPVIELTRAEFFDTQGNALRVHGFADRIHYLRDTGDAWAEQARVFFPRQGNPTGMVTLKTPRAEGNPLDEFVTGSQGVGFSNAVGDRGFTQRASYDGRAGIAQGDAPVHLWGPRYQLTAPHFRWLANSNRLDLGPATVVSGENP